MTLLSCLGTTTSDVIARMRQSLSRSSARHGASSLPPRFPSNDTDLCANTVSPQDSFCRRQEQQHLERALLIRDHGAAPLNELLSLNPVSHSSTVSNINKRENSVQGTEWSTDVTPRLHANPSSKRHSCPESHLPHSNDPLKPGRAIDLSSVRKAGTMPQPPDATMGAGTVVQPPDGGRHPPIDDARFLSAAALWMPLPVHSHQTRSHTPASAATTRAPSLERETDMARRRSSTATTLTPSLERGAGLERRWSTGRYAALEMALENWSSPGFWAAELSDTPDCSDSSPTIKVPLHRQGLNAWEPSLCQGPLYKPVQEIERYKPVEELLHFLDAQAERRASAGSTWIYAEKVVCGVHVERCSGE